MGWTWAQLVPICLSLSRLYLSGPKNISDTGFSSDISVHQNVLRASESDEVTPGETETINFVGTYHWQLVMDIVNPDNTEFIRATTYNTTTTASYDEIVTTTWNASAEGDTNFKIGFPLLKLVGLSLSGNVAPSVASAYSKTMTTKTNTMESVIKTTNIKIGANSNYTLYQLIFVGPGLTQALDSLSFEKKPMENVIISVTYQKIFFLKGIDIVRPRSEAEMPSNVVQEIYRNQPNLNYAYGGRPTFLVPKWTANPSEALTSLAVVVQQREEPTLQEMGDVLQWRDGWFHRYLVTQLDLKSVEKITSVGLVRRSTIFAKGEAMGWMHCSSDINTRRQVGAGPWVGSFLYLCWNTTRMGKPLQRQTYLPVQSAY